MSVSLRVATGDDVLLLRHRPAQPRAVDLDDQHWRSTWKEKLRPSPTWPNPLACTPVVMSSTANSWLPNPLSAARVMTVTIPSPMPPPQGATSGGQFAMTVCLHLLFDQIHVARHRELPVATPTKHHQPAGSLLGAAALAICGIRGLLVEPGRRPAADDRARPGRGVSPGDRRTGGRRATRWPATRRPPCSTQRPARWWCSAPDSAGQSVVTALPATGAARIGAAAWRRRRR